MRHRVHGKRLGRDKDHRASLLRNLSTSFILSGKVETTLAKAKFVQPYVEKLITKAKVKDFARIKLVRKRLVSEAAVKSLFDEIAPKYKNRSGGYTRIVKLGRRSGDNAPLARLEWVGSSDGVEEPKGSKEAK